jgi:surface antigen
MFTREKVTVFLLLLASVQVTFAQSHWWNANWNYRVLLIVEPADDEQANNLVAATINFTIALKAAKAKGIFVANTIRVVEVNQAGILLDQAVPFQFDLDREFHPTRKAQGTLLFLLKGPTATTRYFHLYFDTNERLPAINLTTEYRLSDALSPQKLEQLRNTMEPFVVNLGAVETRPAPPAVRARTVKIENMARSVETNGNAAEPAWKNKPEHPFFGGYCTWYAAKKWKEFTGAPVTWSGDAGRWFDNAAEEGRNVSEDPKAAVKGAIMVWTRNGAAGHVAVVEEVNAEGVFITEMNVYRRWVVSEAFLPFTNLDKGTRYKFRGYILPE